jgi:hypothetical protein
MKHLKLITTIFLSAILFMSCLGNSSATASKDSATSQGKGKGTITCLIDGKQKTFNVQQSFFEISLDPYSKGPKDGIEILDGDSKREGFQFEIKKSGTTKITNGINGCIINYYNPDGVTYTGEDVTVVVTSYIQNQLTGTFSGKLTNVYYDGGSKIAKKYPQFIHITEGKFDIQQ